MNHKTLRPLHCMSILSVLVGFCFSADVLAASFRFHVASQYNWGKSTGFYLAFETDSAKPPCTTEGMNLAWMVGNGKRWFYTYRRAGQGKWEADRVYAIKAIVDNQARSVELWVDGRLSEKVTGNYVPEEASLRMNMTTSEYPGPADLIVAPLSMKITSGGKVAHDFVFESGKRAAPNILICPYVADACRELEFKTKPGDSLIIETKLKFIYPSRAKDSAPYVDRYFQWRYGDWPDKVKSDDELKKRMVEERELLKSWTPPKGYDKYGGCTEAGWKEKGTGFFSLAHQNGYYWLISPEGNPCFYTGFCGVGLDADTRWPPTPVTGRESYFEWLPPKTGEYASAWMRDAWGEKGVDNVLPVTANLIRKYGADWQKAKNRITFQRMKAWGFSGGGKWARQNPDEIAFAWMPVLDRGDTPRLAGHADVFDPKVREAFEKVLREQCESYRKNPWLIGLSFGNEDGELIFADEIKSIMAMKSEVPAKRALIDHALGSLYKGRVADLAKAWEIKSAKTISDVYGAKAVIPDGDIDEMRLFYLDRYHEFIYRTIKKYDSNHLYFGFWIPGWRAIWTHPKDWAVAAKHCDVLGYDHYDLQFLRPEFAPRVNEVKKPILCGEFGWATYHQGTRGFATWHWEINTPAEVGELYRKWVTDAARNPYCVGMFYFEHHDESCLGRGPGHGAELQYGESLAWGLVDVTDTPKWDLVKKVRETNLQVTAMRLEAMKKGRASESVKH